MINEYRPAKEVFDYDDIMLIPQQCVVKSRSEVSVSTRFGDHEFALPIVPANMSTIVNEGTALWLAQRGYFYVLHRFDVDPVNFTRLMHEFGQIASISLGIKQVDYEILERFRHEAVSPDYITVDVAHGDSEEVFKIVKAVRSLFPNVFIIAGNVATVEGAQRLADSGADAVKVGIGPGCFTGEMLVKTITGLKQIKDIQVNEQVLTHTGEYKKVTNVFQYEKHDKIIEVNGIKCTPEHEFYVCNKEDLPEITEENYKDYCFWVKAKDLDEEKHLSLKIEN